MADAAGSGDPGPAMRSSIACEPCRHKKRKCDRKLPCCQQCSHDPSKCYYPEQNKRGLPPGFTAKLEARLAETEAALFHVLPRERTHGAPAATGSMLVTPSSTSTGNQSKADRVKEWETLPLRSDDEIEAWFRWKGGTSGELQQTSMRGTAEHHHTYDSIMRSSCQPGHVSSLGGLQSSPDYVPPAASPATLKTSTSEGAASGRAKELSESQRNLYF